MVKPGKDVFEAAARINASEARFVAFLEARWADYINAMVSQVDEIQLRITQGRAQEVSALLDLLKSASDMLRKA